MSTPGLLSLDLDKSDKQCLRLISCAMSRVNDDVADWRVPMIIHFRHNDSAYDCITGNKAAPLLALYVFSGSPLCCTG